jgi:dTDP-4-dehydrorhamnose reductase
VESPRLKVAILGNRGQLGADVAAAFQGHEVIPVDHSTADITNEADVTGAIANAGADWVINCAAMTDVDGCETNPAAAFAANAVGARNIARATLAADASLIHISTDYVFDGKKQGAYIETDATRALNVYGMTKLLGEWFVEQECSRHYILRTSGLYGMNPCRGKGTNFVETMLRLGAERDTLTVVSDERLTPTFTEDVAAQITAMIAETPPWGIYHATNEGSCSWYEFAVAIFAGAGIEIEVNPISASEWKTQTVRASNTVLENAALKRASCNTFPEWKDALSRYLERRLS